MDNPNRMRGRGWFLGWGLGAMLACSLILFVSSQVLNRPEVTTSYPGATLLARRAEHQLLAGQFFWQEDYLSPAAQAEIYRWYSDHLGLTVVTEQWVDNECFVLYDFDQLFMIDYSLGVLVCNAAGGQKISVSRSVSLRRSY